MPPQFNVDGTPIQNPVPTAPTPNQTFTPPPFVPPSAPTFVSNTPPNMQPPKKGHGSLIAAIIAVLIVIGAAGAVAYAYVAQIGPFARPPYSADKMASGIFAGIGLVKQSSYELKINVASEPRDADAEPFVSAVPQDSKILAFKNDQDKVRSLEEAMSSLRTYYYSHKKYPDTLAEALSEGSVNNNSLAYYKNADGTDYSLKVTFETGDAIDAVKSYSTGSSTTIVNKTVTFTKNSRSYIYMPSEPAQPGIVNIMNLQKSFSSMPAGAKFEATLSGASVKTSEDNTNGKVHIGVSVEAGDLNASVDGEVRKVEDAIYVVVNKVPNLFFDVSKIKTKWIKITSDDLAAYGQGLVSSDPGKVQKDVTKAKEDAIKGIKTFLTLADKYHALVISKDPQKETVDGVSAYRYELQFNKDTLADFYTELTSEFQKLYDKKNPIEFDQATLDYLKSPQFAEIFNYFRKNTSLTIWADSQGIPLKATYGLRVVPDSGKNSSQQIKLSVSLSLHDVNMPVNIDIPSPTMSVEDATISFTGQSREQYNFSKQSSAVSTVRSALYSYKSMAGSYPNSLEDLKKTRADIKKLNPNYSSKTSEVSFYSSSYDEKPLLSVVPVDTFTKQPLGYTKVGDDYTLTYTQKLPPYVSGTEIPYSLYDSSYLSPIPTIGSRSSSNTRIVSLKYVEGTNTADSKVISREATALAKTDSDGDGLSDSIEAYIGTNPNKKDTDGDGTSDGAEISRGSNPLGPGDLTNGSDY